MTGQQLLAFWRLTWQSWWSLRPSWRPCSCIWSRGIRSSATSGRTRTSGANILRLFGHNWLCWRASNQGQWLWLSWESDRFHQQRSVIQIQSSANFISFQIFWSCVENTKREKEAVNDPIKNVISTKLPSHLKLLASIPNLKLSNPQLWRK